MVDTGATISFLHPDKYYAIPKQNRPSLEPYTLKLRMGDGALIPTLGCAVIPLQFKGQITPQKMVIADIDSSGVLGYDFLYENAASIISQDGSLVLNGDMIQCELESELPSVFRVTLSEIVTIPPNSEIIVQGKINDKLNNLTHAKVEPTSSQLSNRGILIAKPLVDVHTGELLLRLANTLNDSQKIYSGTLAAKCEPVEVIANDYEGPSKNYRRLMPAPNEHNSVPVHLRTFLTRQKHYYLKRKL